MACRSCQHCWASGAFGVPREAPSKIPNRTCVWCGTAFYVPPSGMNRKACSARCVKWGSMRADEFGVPYRVRWFFDYFVEGMSFAAIARKYGKNPRMVGVTLKNMETAIARSAEIFQGTFNLGQYIPRFLGDMPPDALAAVAQP